MEITAMNLVSLHGQRVGAHAHEIEHEFHFFVRGEGRFTQDGHRVKIRPGVLHYATPGSAHDIVPANSAGPLNFFFVRFSPDGTDAAVLSVLESVFARSPRVRLGPGATVELEEIHHRVASPDPYMHQAGTYRFLSFVYELKRPGMHRFATEADRYTMQAVRLLQERIYTKVNLEDIARRVGIGKAHLIRLFGKRMGMPPMKYYHRLKVQTAGYLLRRTGEPIYTIARRLNFYDEYHFSKMFKQVMGVSPRAFRRGAETDGVAGG